jgi:hypothetical protein
MAKGTLLQHPTLRGCFLVAMMPPKTRQGRWYPLRLNFNGQGQTVVSQGVLEEISMAEAIHEAYRGMTVVGELHTPEDLGLNPPTQVRGWIADGATLKEFNADQWDTHLKERAAEKKRLLIAKGRAS